MTYLSKISWCDHTYNEWIGCTKVGVGCANCYAERDWDKRYGRVKWGAAGQRVRTSESNRKKPYTWDKQVWLECSHCHWRGDYAKLKLGFCPGCHVTEAHEMLATRQRVFTSSLSDVFEAKYDQQEELAEWRASLFKTIEATTNLDWLVLTKRPENIVGMIPDHWLRNFPQNVWLGTSASTEKAFVDRWYQLGRVGHQLRPSVLFWSAEPLLGAVDFEQYDQWFDGLGDEEHQVIVRKPDWIIVGGESGAAARPMLKKWVSDLCHQCAIEAIPFHFKQWGEWLPYYNHIDAERYAWHITDTEMRHKWRFENEYHGQDSLPLEADWYFGTKLKRAPDMARVGRKRVDKDTNAWFVREFPK